MDLGSGLGVDSFIAAETVGEQGKVIGLDIAKKEVNHTSKRAEKRGVDNRVKFVCADMEKIPLSESMIDCIISNGAFCLAPNKEAAFKEMYRVLKPGGRFSVSTSVMTERVDQNDGKTWPICMRMFVNLPDLEPMLKSVGFNDVFID